MNRSKLAAAALALAATSAAFAARQPVTPA